MINTSKLKQQKEAMERKRFGATRAEILKKKGARCAICGSTEDLVIDHPEGGGRHDTERGMFVEGKTHNIKKMRILCRSCAGKADRLNFVRGIGKNTKGSPTNPSQ